ncbi:MULTISPECIES: pentapeptide repeat-containing protein [unclassified Streptomyces]|uniref:Pentapeptide repeat-containing protein n=1 Tax=Streptomyces sp. NBC_00060 TaxID=2975636 RepID=A0AAU2H362_9ACTN
MFTPTLRMLVKWISGPDWTTMDGAARSAALGQFRLALVQVAAVLGAGIALLFTAFNYRLTRRGQVTDRFTKALERLGSDQLYVRIGGVLALEQIVQDAPDQATHASQVLVSFIRERAPRAERLSASSAREQRIRTLRATRRRQATVPRDSALLIEPAADVQAALTALTRPSFRANVDAGVRPLRTVNLSGLHLERVNLRGADLKNVDLAEANLSRANLKGADLTDARLWRTDLTRAWLEGVNFTRAWMREAHLCRADLSEAVLADVKLGKADLTEARLSMAVLTNADFMDSHIPEETGQGGLAVLAAANLTGVDLRSAAITVDQILSAKPDRATRLAPDMAAHPQVGAYLDALPPASA